MGTVFDDADSLLPNSENHRPPTGPRDRNAFGHPIKSPDEFVKHKTANLQRVFALIKAGNQKVNNLLLIYVFIGPVHRAITLLKSAPFIYTFTSSK